MSTHPLISLVNDLVDTSIAAGTIDPNYYDTQSTDYKRGVIHGINSAAITAYAAGAFELFSIFTEIAEEFEADLPA